MSDDLDISLSQPDHLVDRHGKRPNMDDKNQLWVENTLREALDSRDVHNGADFKKYVEKEGEVEKEKDIVEKFSDAVFTDDDDLLVRKYSLLIKT